MPETLTASRRTDPAALPPSLVSLVGEGKDVESIGKTLGLSNEEVRARLQKTGLLTIVEPPEGVPANSEPTPAPVVVVAPAPPPPPEEPPPMPTPAAAAAPTNGAPVPTKKKRGPKPKAAAAVATPPPAAKPAKKRGGGRPTNVELVARREAAARTNQDRTRLAYGTLYLAAAKSGVPVEELVVAAARIIAND